jgi:hypothetical protein
MRFSYKCSNRSDPAWFSLLAAVNDENGKATLTEAVRDQDELHGLLDRVFDLNLTLLAIHRITDPAE